MRIPRSASPLVLGTLVAALTLGACSSSGTDGTAGRLSVVTSTNVWGGLAAQVGGSAVDVTSFISDAAQDPHSYEASAHDQLELSRADVVIENGGGYDDFMTQLADASGGHATVLDAVRISGKHAPAGSDLNEHVWYDFPTVSRVVTKLVAVLSSADATHAAAFAANGRRLQAGLSSLEATEKSLAGTYRGTGVAITEPVPLYLLSACGLVDRTPAVFSRSIEDGSGVPAAALAQTEKLFSTHSVAALVYNSQTSGPETDQVVGSARSAGVPAVPVTETMPQGDTYLSWMRANLAAVSTALAHQ